MQRRWRLVMLIPFVLAACADQPIAGPNEAVSVADVPLFASTSAASNVTVASVNMYFGAPVDAIIAAPQDTIPFLVAEAWQVFLQTNAPARAHAIAAQLAQAKPQLIGLQEVAQFWTEEFFDPTSTDEETLHTDFLELLLDELAARNMDYEVAVAIELTNIELPKIEFAGSTPYLSGVRLIDRDVILVRSDVDYGEVAMSKYSTWLGPDATGGMVPIDVYRGWTAVTASLRGREFRFVNTHLESEDSYGLWAIRTAQAYELAEYVLMAETRPLVVVGDFNSGPGRPLADGEDLPAYMLMLSYGYADAWDLQAGNPGPGYTCCHAGDLSNTMPALDQRIDLVFVRNMEGLGRRGGGMPIVQGAILNDDRQDLKQYGVWSSDHAAPVARLVLPAPQMAKK